MTNRQVDDTFMPNDKWMSHNIRVQCMPNDKWMPHDYATTSQPILNSPTIACLVLVSSLYAFCGAIMRTDDDDYRYMYM